MIDFKRIVFPVDLSDGCRRVAPFVRAMAKRFESEVTLLHVIEFPASWYGPPEGVAWEVISDADRLRVKRTEAFRYFLVDDFADVRVKREVAEGDPAAQIDCFAKTAKAGLIMMPTHGFGTFRRLLLGSVTAKVLHDTHCPVWTGVHLKATANHNADRCRRVLCAVDTNPKDAKVIRWAAEFAKERNAELSVIHAVAGADSELHTPFQEFLFKVAGEDLEGVLRDSNLGETVERKLASGKPERVVRDVAQEQEADLVVIGRGVDGAFGRLRSSAYAIIRESPCPVISV